MAADELEEGKLLASAVDQLLRNAENGEEILLDNHVKTFRKYHEFLGEVLCEQIKEAGRVLTQLSTLLNKISEGD